MRLVDEKDNLVKDGFYTDGEFVYKVHFDHNKQLKTVYRKYDGDIYELLSGFEFGESLNVSPIEVRHVVASELPNGYIHVFAGM